MFRKVSLIAVAIVGTALLLASCAPKNAQSNAKHVTLQAWIYSSFAAADAPIFAAADKFMKENPNIKVQLVPLTYGSSSYLNKYVVAFQARTAPDSLMSDVAWVPDLAAMDSLLRIDQQAASDIKSFYPGPVQTVTYKDHILGLPFYTNDLAMFYNKSAFESAGLQQPAEEWTWADFVRDAKALTKGSRYGFGFEGGWGGTYEWYPWLWQGGGSLLSPDRGSVAFDSAQGIDATRTFFGLTTTDKVVPPGVLTWKSWSELAAAFSSGVIAMFESGDWQIPMIKQDKPSFEWGVAPLPMGKEKATVVGGADWVINAKSHSADAAYRWIKYITGPAVFDLMDGYGRLAARVGNENQQVVKSDPLMRVFVDELAYSKARPSIPQWTNVDYNCLQPAFQRILLKGAHVSSALSEAAACGNQALAKK